ncbi:MAG: Sec-independent protein translocase protein TatB [Actinomycetota bacterium]|nr:Sec-independent protein translocase protein TatB [Actinomycetota bacterium]
MFNVQGSELIFLLLIALVVLGPEKLPDAVRKFGKGYAEFKKMANGFQGELRQALDEPLRELRDTADAVRDAAKFDIDSDGKSPAAKTDAASTSGQGKPGPLVSEIASKAATSVKRGDGLNFGAARRAPSNGTVPVPDAPPQPAQTDAPTPSDPAVLPGAAQAAPTEGPPE